MSCSLYFLILLVIQKSISSDDMKSEQCSIFDFEQKLLEKLVRLGIKTETLSEKVDDLEKTLVSTMKQLDDLKRQRLEDQRKGFGATYIRWSRTDCPSENELVYAGYAGGGRYNQDGSAAEPVCLPKDPEFNKTSGTDTGRMYGVEYDTSLFASNSNSQDVPCAVCRTYSTSSVIMIPGKISCHSGWRREYYGYLASGHHGNKAANTYVCVDINPEYVPGGSAWNSYSKLFYEVLAKCGVLKCPPYHEGYPLTCVVCSK